VPITLSSRSLRRTALAGATAALSIALTACAASFNAPTLQPYQAAEGTNADSGSIHVRNMLVLANEDGKGELHSAIVNNGSTDDTLVKIEQAPAGTQDGQAGADQPTDVTFSEIKPLDLKAGTSTLLPGPGAETSTGETPSETPTATPSAGETPGAEASGPAITVTGAKPGQMVNVIITFGKGAPITTYIPVLTEDHYSPSPSGE
jgi:hypothetical protein